MFKKLRFGIVMRRLKYGSYASNVAYWAYGPVCEIGKAMYCFRVTKQDNIFSLAVTWTNRSYVRTQQIQFASQAQFWHKGLVIKGELLFPIDDKRPGGLEYLHVVS